MFGFARGQLAGEERVVGEVKEAEPPDQPKFPGQYILQIRDIRLDYSMQRILTKI